MKLPSFPPSFRASFCRFGMCQYHSTCLFRRRSLPRHLLPSQLAEYKKEIERLKGLLANGDDGGSGGGVSQDEFDTERQGRRRAEQGQKQLQAQIDFMQSQVLPTQVGAELASPRI